MNLEIFTRASIPTLFMRFDIPGNPLPKQRPRVTRRGITYTPKETVKAEAFIKKTVKELYPTLEPMLDDLGIVILFARKDKRRVDGDNLKKLFFDAGNKLLWADDHQIKESHIKTIIDSDNPRTEIGIYLLKQP